jgi:hypothetical protein
MANMQQSRLRTYAVARQYPTPHNVVMSPLLRRCRLRESLDRWNLLRRFHLLSGTVQHGGRAAQLLRARVNTLTRVVIRWAVACNYRTNSCFSCRVNTLPRWLCRRDLRDMQTGHVFGSMRGGLSRTDDMQRQRQMQWFRRVYLL